MSIHDPLGDALRRKAAEVGNDHPLDLGDVKDRATGIRRRRVAVSGLAAAAVLAAVVPLGMALDDRVTGAPAPGPAASGPATPTPTPTPGAAAPRDGVLTTRVEARSGAPGIPYLLDGSLRTPAGDVVPVEGGYDEVAALGDGWLAADFASGTVAFLDSDGDVTGTDVATGELAVSADGTVVVYARPDGTLMTAVADDDGSPLTRPLNDPATAPDAVRPVAVTGSAPCGTGGDCVVFFDGEQDGSPHGFSAASDGTVVRLGALRSVRGVSAGGAVAGLLSVADDGSCSAMQDVGGQELWSTCDHTLGQLSPDGRYVVGRPAYLDGIGDASVAILDAGTGEVLAEWRSTRATQAFINDSAWDTDGTLLATVFEKGSWSLMRMGPDGSLTTALPDLGDDMDEVPLRLATRP